MPQNIEIKRRCSDLKAMRERLHALGARRERQLHHRDTYFHARRGRLKLREISGQGAELIAYERPDAGGAQVSEYTSVAVTRPAELLQALHQSLGVRTVVTKERELWLHDATRIHLDRVERLGCFVELETVVGVRSLEEAQAEYERVAAALGIDSLEPVATSYADLLVAQSTGKEEVGRE